jgi:hypothetical protein
MNLAHRCRPDQRLVRRVVTNFVTAVVLLGCSGAPSAEVSNSRPTSTSAPIDSLSSTSPSLTSPPTTSPPASSVCSLVSTPQVTRLLQAGDVTVEPTSTGCRWFAADANVNASLAVNFYDTAREASTTFQSEQTFDSGQHPYAFGDRAYTSVLAGVPRHATAKVLIGAAIVTAVVNGPTPPASAVAAAQAIVEPASARVRQGWRY